jgi:hypothetical protein
VLDSDGAGERNRTLDLLITNFLRPVDRNNVDTSAARNSLSLLEFLLSAFYEPPKAYCAKRATSVPELCHEDQCAPPLAARAPPKEQARNSSAFLQQSP